MTRTIRPAPVRKSITVNTAVDRAFEIFTTKIARWWPGSKSIGSSPQAGVVLEAGVGGRWYERGEDGSECNWGKVLVWEPPHRLVLAWQINANWQYDPDFLTELEVKFIALSPHGTRVDLEHRDLERFAGQADKIRAAFDSDDGWNGVLRAFGASSGE
jgi:uncharacterized protein YndB with AHSA1/START domain